MRTALLLLLLLAVVAVPGSVLPQRSSAPDEVATWIEEHGRLGELVDRLGGFNVYSSPWFAAVYLLLFTSLVGCVIPRTRVHWKALRSRPPATPRRLERLPVHRSFVVDGPPEQVLGAAREQLRGFRVEAYPQSLAAERGYAKESANLLFHVALLLLLVTVAVGQLVGYTANKVVVEGGSFVNAAGQYDSVRSGARFDGDSLPPFKVTLDRLDVRYEQDGPRIGEPRRFDANVTWSHEAGTGSASVAPNHPLEIDGTKVFLTGNGYAPVFRVTDSTGTVVYEGPQPFLPRDTNMTSLGAVKAPSAAGGGLAFSGFFLPTATVDDVLGPISTYPDLVEPKVFLNAYRGAEDGRAAGSVFTLDTEGLDRVEVDGQPWLAQLAVGESATLPDGQGTIELLDVIRFANFQVSDTTGNGPTLAAAVLALVGLMGSLLLRRRRVWVRATPGDDGRTVVEVAGLGKGDADGLVAEVERVTDGLRTSPGTLDTHRTIEQERQ
nr:cytochrome c biogenesis protein ResB [Motilibacter aurantiacus]